MIHYPLKFKHWKEWVKFSFLGILIIIASYIFLRKDSSVEIVDCQNNYDCLYQQISQGRPAKIIVTERLDTLLLEETSKIEINPSNNGFVVVLTVIELNKISSTQPVINKGAVGAVLDNYSSNAADLMKLKSTSATCITQTASEAKELAINGLTNIAVKKYSCQGSLVDELERINNLPDYPDYPILVKKPAVYLYPSQESEISVKVEVKGKITKSEPNYQNGWRVNAQPNGKINNQYDYLFYEVQLDQLQFSKEGWVVEYEKLVDWFDNYLPQFGLNDKEISQFREYWLAELPIAQYYEIRLLEDNFLEENIKLIIDPKPTTIIRRIFYFKPLMDKIELKQPQNISAPERNGFSVVEWGGLLGS